MPISALLRSGIYLRCPFMDADGQWEHFSQPQSCLNLEIDTDYIKEALFLLFYKSGYLVSLQFQHILKDSCAKQNTSFY